MKISSFFEGAKVGLKVRARFKNPKPDRFLEPGRFIIKLLQDK
jgi:hypothetical protein